MNPCEHLGLGTVARTMCEQQAALLRERTGTGAPVPGASRAGIGQALGSAARSVGGFLERLTSGNTGGVLEQERRYPDIPSIGAANRATVIGSKIRTPFDPIIEPIIDSALRVGNFVFGDNAFGNVDIAPLLQALAMPVRRGQLKAALFDPNDPTRVFTGAHHGETENAFYRAMGVKDPERGITGRDSDRFRDIRKGMVEGFQLPDGRLATREEAAQYANEAKYLKPRSEGTTILHSSDIQQPLAPSVPVRRAFTNPKGLSETALNRQAEIQQRIADYVQRPDNSAPADFGGAALLGKGELDEEFATRIASAFERMQSNPSDPATQKAYAAFAQEIDEQFDFVTNELGIRMVPTQDDPYANSAEMMQDLLENNQLRVFTGGEPHALLSPEHNVKFRFIHDVMGHGAFGNSFGPIGEENAFRMHSEVFSGEARRALASETRGQNSWVNFGPHGAANRADPANTKFATQKAALLPDEFVDTRAGKRGLLDEDIARMHGSDGGTTIDPRTGRSMLGQNTWAVATPTQHLQKTPLTPDDVRAFREKNKKALAEENAFIGSWNDVDKAAHGMHELNITRLYDNYDDAIKAAQDAGEKRIMNLSDFREVDVPRPLGMPIDVRAEANARFKAGTRTQAARAATDEEIFGALAELPSEQAAYSNLSEKQRATVRNMYLKAPEARHIASAILAGAPARGWYAQAADALQETFGDIDSVRFAALLAATSPNTAVDRNLKYALDGWKKWLELGRSTSPDAMREVIDAMGHMYANSIRNSVQKALSAVDDELLDPTALTEGGFFKGPKIDPFYANLVGEQQRLVLDTHMARGVGTSPTKIGNKLNNLAITAAFRKAGELIEKRTGQRLDGREMQEMFWTFVREGKARGGRRNESELALLRELGVGTGGEDNLFGAVPFEQTQFAEALKDVPDFASLLANKYAGELEAIGLKPPGARKLPGMDVPKGEINMDDLRRILQRVQEVSVNNPLFSLAPGLLGVGAALQSQQQK